MQIERVQMTHPHYDQGKPGRVRMLVLHATAGSYPGDYGWLRGGGDERRPVSVHYYISKAGRIVQLVDDAMIAWHAGESRWMVDGRQVAGCNALSLGIELENLNSGRDPYPSAQYAAALWLCRELVARHKVPRSQLVRHLDIAPGRKTDPAGFPWERFVNEVYADSPAHMSSLPALSTQLRARLLDLAYRAAGGALAAGWPLFTAAQSAHLGMPVATPTGRPRTGAAGAAQDDQDRAVRMGSLGTFLVEIYARDLLYAPADTPTSDHVHRLSETPVGPLCDGLRELLFRSADPVNGFHADWAFHQYYLQHSNELGVPIGPNQRLRDGGQIYACQHFALDSLCSSASNWKIIYRLSELTAAVAGTQRLPGLSATQAARVRRLLLTSLYRERAGRQFDEGASLVHYALDQRLGAPLGPAEQIDLEDAQLLLMPFALDVIYCRLPTTDWPYDRPLPAGTPIGGFSATLGSASEGTVFGRLADLARPVGDTTLSGDDTTLSSMAATSGYLLGAEDARPAMHNLCDSPPSERPNGRVPVELLLLCAAPGPASADLAAEGAAVRWHYYIDRAGVITRLRDDNAPTRVADQVGRRAVVLACEGGPPGEQAQRAALAWLVRTLIVYLHLSPNSVQILTRPLPLLESI